MIINLAHLNSFLGVHINNKYTLELFTSLANLLRKVSVVGPSADQFNHLKRIDEPQGYLTHPELAASKLRHPLRRRSCLS